MLNLFQHSSWLGPDLLFFSVTSSFLPPVSPTSFLPLFLLPDCFDRSFSSDSTSHMRPKL